MVRKMSDVRLYFQILHWFICTHNLAVYVVARAGVKFGINFTSCSENGNEISQGAAKCNFAVIATSVPLVLSH